MNDNEKKLEQYLNGIDFDDAPDSTHRDLLEKKLLLSFNAPGSRQNVKWSIIMKSKITKITAAAIILLAVGLSITVIPTQSAYAHVVAGLRNVSTLAYTLITSTNTQTGETVSTDWLFKDPGMLRTTTADGYVTILDHHQGVQLSLVPPLKQYITAEFDPTVQNGASGQFAVIESLRQLPEKADEILGASSIDGIDVEGYRVFGEDVIITIWIDLENKELVQVEHQYPSSPGMNFVLNNISFNIELDDALFDLTPPDDYTPLKAFKASTQNSEQDLIDFLRLWGDASANRIYLPISIGPQFSKLIMDLITEGKLYPMAMSRFDPQIMYDGVLFIATLPPSSNWRYAGENVAVGDGSAPIFWYQPVDSDTYRVIYGDLSVVDVSPEQLQEVIILASEPKILPDISRYENMTPKETAEVIFQACAEEDWQELSQFMKTVTIDKWYKNYLDGLEVISIGEPFQTERLGPTVWFVPYEIRLKNGEIKKHNLALRRDKYAKRFVFDGGI